MVQNTVLHGVRKHSHARRKVWLPAAFMCVGMGMYVLLVSLFIQASSPYATVAASAQPQATAPAMACIPATTTDVFSLDLTSAPVGLTTQTDPNAQYQIYGSTAVQLREQIHHCAPGANGSGGAEYTGATSYSMSWQYGVTRGELCSVNNVKVGVHVATVLPLWQPSAHTTGGLSTHWNKFIDALTAHEAGHAALDKLYAAQILNDINALPAMDCSRVDANVKQVVTNDVVALNQANDTYDATTNHGASQGAILPTH